ncbi:MAG: hypothetical protein V4538_15930 [Bacteroidota bacterium]
MKTIYLSVLLLLILFWQSCGKETDGCPPSTNDFYNLTDEEKSKILYTGSDTLVFISNQGDTATLIGQSKKQTYKNITLPLGNPDCGGTNSKNYEQIKYDFTSSNTKLSEINLLIRRDDDEYQYSCYYDWLLNKQNKVGVDALALNDTNYYNDIVVLKSIPIKCFRIRGGGADSTTYIFYNNKLGVVKIALNELVYLKK